MAIFRERPYGNAQFLVELDGVIAPDVLEVHLPELGLEAEEFRTGSDQEVTSQKFPSRPRFGNLVLKRGFRGDLELYNWWKQTVSANPGAKRQLTIHLLSENASGAVCSWRLKGAFPLRYAFSPLDGRDGGILMETMEIAADSVEMF